MEKFEEGVYQPLHIEDDPAPEPIPLQQHFFEESAPGARRQAGNSRSIAVERCRFDSNGEHMTMAEHCPHFDTHDEMGKRIKPGWTVQG